MIDISTIILSILQIVVPAIITLFPVFLLPVYIPKLTARKENLLKLYSVSKTFQSFFTSDLLIRLDRENKKRDFKISMFFTTVGYLILILPIRVPESYYIIHRNSSIVYNIYTTNS